MATTEDNVTKIHDLVLADRRLKIREIAETVGMSKDRVGHILHEILVMKTLSARWVRRSLTPDNKRNQETTSEQCLTLFKRNPKEFLRRFMTVDETWIHCTLGQPIRFLAKNTFFFFKKMTRPSMESFLLYIKLIYAKVSKNSGK